MSRLILVLLQILNKHKGSYLMNAEAKINIRTTPVDKKCHKRADFNCGEL